MKPQPSRLDVGNDKYNSKKKYTGK
jgi:hypothetical protein